MFDIIEAILFPLFSLLKDRGGVQGGRERESTSGSGTLELISAALQLTGL